MTKVTQFYFSPGQTHGDSVTQMEGQVTLSEGISLTVNCSYESAQYPTLFWYVQYPGEGPQLLLKAERVDKKGSNKGFEATYRQQPNTFHLEKNSVDESDSAVYYCALRDTVTETAGGAEHKLWLLSAYDCLIPSGGFYYLTSNTWYINTNFQLFKHINRVLRQIRFPHIQGC